MMSVSGQLPPRKIAPPDNCPLDDTPRIFAPANCSQENFPLDNCHLYDCPRIIAPGQLLQR